MPGDVNTRNTQLIGGQPYQIGTPGWQEATDNFNRQRALTNAATSGLAQGTQSNNAYSSQYAPGTMLGNEHTQTLASGAQDRDRAYTSGERAYNDAHARQMEMDNRALRQQDLAEQQRQFENNLTRENMANKQSARGQLMANVTGEMGGAGGSTTGTTWGTPATSSGGGQVTFPMGGLVGAGPGAGIGAVNPVSPIDTSAAESAIFARAKDKVGQASQGALAGLRSSLAGRGMLGSGAEARGTANVVNSGLGQLGDVSREQAIEGSKLAEEQALENYRGGVTQRGQDITRESNINSLAGENARAQYLGQITQRGQDLEAKNAANAQRIQQQTAINNLIASLY